MFLIAFLSLQRAKNEGEFCATLGNRFPSQSRDARKKNRERNLTWSNFAWLCAILACYEKILHSHAKLLDVRFLLWFSSLHTWLIWKRLRSSPKLGFFMCLSFNLLCHGLYKILPHSWLVLMIKKLSKIPKLAKNWLETFTRVFNVPIELKGNKYYSKVFKRVYNKL